MSAVDVALEGVWKQYRLGTGRHGEPFWALQDVGFEVTRGSSVGIIGRNGAGKSTLLKLLAGITSPTRGRLVIDGRVAALIEVGSGFHPELTGRENVLLSGAILGMRRREIAAKLPRILEFAGVERFKDTPVKRYSSGMYVRLGFAIAAHLEPDILLVDEVLAVGDAEFQLKCLERIEELRRAGTTIVFISHDLTTVERLCDHVVLLEGGRVAAQGEPAAIVAEYHRRLAGARPPGGPSETAGRQRPVLVTNLIFRSPGRQEALAVRTGHPIVIAMRLATSEGVDDIVVELTYHSGDGKTLLCSAASAPLSLRPPGATLEFACPALPLPPGAYYLGAVIRDQASARVLEWWDGATMLHVEPGAATRGVFFAPHATRVVAHDPAGAASGEAGEGDGVAAAPGSRS